VRGVQGENLQRDSRKEDFAITIGDGVCDVTELTDKRVDCKPPSTKPNKQDDDSRCDGETMTLQASVVLDSVLSQRKCADTVGTVLVPFFLQIFLSGPHLILGVG